MKTHCTNKLDGMQCVLPHLHRAMHYNYASAVYWIKDNGKRPIYDQHGQPIPKVVEDMRRDELQEEGIVV